MWLPLSTAFRAAKWVLFLSNFIFSGHISLAVAINHDLITALWVNYFPPLPNKWATWKPTHFCFHFMKELCHGEIVHLKFPIFLTIAFLWVGNTVISAYSEAVLCAVWCVLYSVSTAVVFLNNKHNTVLPKFDYRIIHMQLYLKNTAFKTLQTLLFLICHNGIHW
jgi:hypothetical protein